MRVDLGRSNSDSNSIADVSINAADGSGLPSVLIKGQSSLFNAGAVAPAPAVEARASANPHADWSKLQAGLDNLYAEAQAAMVGLSGADRNAAMADFSSRFELAPVEGGYVTIDAFAADGDGAALLKVLETLGLENGAAFGSAVSGRLPMDALGDLAAVTSLSHARPVLAMTNVGSVTSLDGRALRADVVTNAFGLDGTGVTVGILSDSFDTSTNAIDYAADIASGDLPGDVLLLDDSVTGSDEGRGMAQLIHDIAPGAALQFHTAFGGIAGFAQGILDLAAAGSDIIVDDVIFFAEPMFQDGIIAQAVDMVDAMGIPYFSSAGNNGDDSLEDAFRLSGVVDGTFGQLHDWDSGAGVDTALSITIGAGQNVLFVLNWDEPFGQSASDLDIILTSGGGLASAGTLLAGSAAVNIAGDPLEIFSFTNTANSAQTFDLNITLFEGAAPSLLKIVAFGGFTVNEHVTLDKSTSYGHANAEGALAVGAAFYFDTPEFGVDPALQEDFSSKGGVPILFDVDGSRLTAPIIRDTVDFTATDGGNTTFFGQQIGDGDNFPNFFGTSAAAPNAAAVAALLKQAFPDATPDQIEFALESTALDIVSDFTGAPLGTGNDVTSGAGLIQANAALATLEKLMAPLTTTTVLDEDFETNGNPARYTTSAPEYTDGSGDFFTRTDGSNIGSFYSVTGFGGSSYFAGMDLNGDGAAGTQTLSFSGLDISGLTALQFAIDVAEDDDGANQDWDADSALIIEYQIDGGGFQNLLAFQAAGGTNTEPLQDTDFDGVGDGTALTSVFATFSAAIAGTGSLLDLRITFANLDDGDEDAAIDNIVITGESAGGGDPQPGTFSIDDPSVIEGDSGTTDLVFTVTRSGGSEGAVSAAWTVTGGTFTFVDLSGDTSGTVNFADGQTTATITFAVNGDTDIEPDDTIIVRLSNPTGGVTITDATGTGTILNDDVVPQGPAEVFINEIHYDTTGSDVGEFIEVAGPAGTDLTGWTLQLYNGNGGVVYDVEPLTGIIPDQDDGFGTLALLIPSIQNGSPDGVALVNAAGQVVQFVSYEGTVTATNGPAAGMTSVDIGVSETSAPAGTSLQAGGTGFIANDFAFQPSQVATFGQVNTGQDFVTGNPAGTLYINDASAAEGDEGTTVITFNVFRVGGSTGTVSASWGVGFDPDVATDANTADFASTIGGTFGSVSFADGETFKTIKVLVNGDTNPEPTEFFDVVLFNPGGGVSIGDGLGRGTIVNDDPLVLNIGQIQGAGHTSPFVGNEVTTSGIVTATASNGFYLQDAGDGDSATSDGIFVFTSSVPTVFVGDGITVMGTVSEFRPGGDPANLTITQLTSPTITIDSTGNALPAAVLIGPDGISPPTEVIEDDGFTSFDPATDGIDFWENLEGMLVTVQNPVAVDSTNQFGELWTVASDGAGNLTATNVSDTGLVVIDGGAGGFGVFNAGAGSDFNPERIQIEDATLNGFNASTPVVTPGTVLNEVTGIVSYAFENFELLPTAPVTVAQASSNVAETTTLVQGAGNQLSIASYNILNFDINEADGDTDIGNGRLTSIAQDIGLSLAAPDIVALQEVQDDSGSANDGTTSALLTLQAIADEIFNETGIRYAVLDNPFVDDGQNGGQPGGNIRVAFLYRDDRVALDPASVTTVTDGLGNVDAAFGGSRSPLIANFAFNGQTVTVVNNHFSSKGGSDSSFSAIQPPTNAGALNRAAQAAAVNSYVDTLLAANADANVVVLGDLNEFQFEEPLLVLTGELDFDGATVTPAASEPVLTNLSLQLDPEDRYSFVFQGNAQLLDHILVSGNLVPGASIDAVRVNTPLGNPSSDHDPILALLNIGPIEGTEGADIITGGSGNDTINGNGGNDTLNGGDGNDTIDGGVGADIIAGGDGDDTLIGGTGRDRLTGGAGADNFVLDASGAGRDAEIITDFALEDTITVRNSDGEQVVFSQRGTTVDIRSGGLLVATVLNATLAEVEARTVIAFDAPPSINVINGTVGDDVLNGTDGADQINGGNGNNVMNGLGGNDEINGGNGVDTVSGGDGDDVITGGFANDILNGDGGNDTIFGGGGQDILDGGAGNDILEGGAGIDTLTGGLGSDIMTGGAGRDNFLIDAGATEADADTITDFAPGEWDLIDIANADGKAFVFAQTGSNVTITADNVLVATLNNALVSGVLARTKFDADPASISEGGLIPSGTFSVISTQMLAEDAPFRFNQAEPMATLSAMKTTAPVDPLDAVLNGLFASTHPLALQNPDNIDAPYKLAPIDHSIGMEALM